MDIDLYKSFLAIYDTGSFTRAAREVGRTQSAISQQIRRLEETLGRPLFTRAAGNVELTEYGKSLLGFARDIVETHTEALAAFSRGSFQGLVVLGIPDGYVKRVMREMLLEFTALYPEATVNVVIDDSPGLARRIADGSVDLTFLTEGNWPMRGEIVFNDRLVIAGPATGDLHKADPLPLAAWDERAFDHRLMIEALEGMNRRYHIACICRSVYGKHVAMTAGLCASVMVESSLIEGERAYLPEDGFPVLSNVAVRLERSHLKKSQVIDRLERHLLEHFST
jgi:DNA-binding transcriptional LysR family regulator